MDTISNVIPIDDITAWAPEGSCRQLRMLRLDAIHPVVSGNKWFKLRYNISDALALGKGTILSFGGGYSNHLVATAFAAHEAGMQSIGIVRGHYAGAQMTPTLFACESYGMKLIPFTKSQYDTDVRAGLAQQFPDAHIIPEGGANEAGIRGATEIAGHIPEDVTDVCLAVGTGTTLAGLHCALPLGMRLHGFCAARSCDGAHVLLNGTAHREYLHIHCVVDSRFGKWTEEQLRFMKNFHAQTQIPLDVVYTAKMMQRLESMLREGVFGPERNVLCIHTGGLQGNPPCLFA